MSISAIKLDEAPHALRVSFNVESLTVELSDGRALSVPLTWYPRLLHGTPREREDWRLMGGGSGMHWPSLDEDIRVEDLLQGRSSMESEASLARWLDERKQ